MNKEEYIVRYGEEAYAKMQSQRDEWTKDHRETQNIYRKKWADTHPEEVRAAHQARQRKGGKYYDRNLVYEHTGLRGERNKVRYEHNRIYRPYKKIIDPDGLSIFRHEWIPASANYRGVALVEKDQHMHGFVDVIEIVECDITLFTEEEVRNGGQVIDR